MFMTSKLITFRIYDALGSCLFRALTITFVITQPSELLLSSTDTQRNFPVYFIFLSYNIVNIDFI